ncbi:MAG: hypothetical protein L0I29_18755 [Hyphomicrobiales bacterium]|nr:hypothetical protein [Hyphomicrobiales bacterium]
MSARRLLLAAAVAVFGLTLAGCVDGGPYYGTYTYSDYDGPYYGPGYYSGVVYGGYYSSHRGHYDRRHHRRQRSHHRNGTYRNHVADHDRGRNWRHGGNHGQHRAAVRRPASGNVSGTSSAKRDQRGRNHRRWEEKQRK